MDFKNQDESIEDSAKQEEVSTNESNENAPIIEKENSTISTDVEVSDNATHPDFEIEEDEANEDSSYCQNDIVTLVDFEKLPSLFKNVCASFDNKDKEMMLLTTLTVVSSTLPNVYGIYNHERVYPNLFLYLVGKAGSGKGNITWAKRLLKAIENTTIHELTGVSRKSLLPILTNPDYSGMKIQIPANNTYAGFVRLLQLQKGTGLVFETEGDTLYNALKSEHGNFSDLLRKAFHHEPITQFRKAGDEFVNLQEPKLSVVISSTPNQLTKIISNSENGLFSRFMFCETESDDTFLDVFSKREVSRQSAIDAEAQELKALFLKLRNGTDVCFALTPEQQQIFLEFFQYNKSIAINLFHTDLEATIHRLGLILFRIAMILTVFRNSKSDDIENLICTDYDFEVSKQLVERLLESANKMFQSLPKQDADVLTEKKQLIYIELSNEFSTKDIKRLFKKHGLSERTVFRFLDTKCFIKIGHGRYRKSE
jgi:hypothetical protein